MLHIGPSSIPDHKIQFDDQTRAWTWGSHWRRSSTNQRASNATRRFIDIPHSPRIIKADKKEEGIVCFTAISRRGFVTPPALPIAYSPSHLPLRWLNRVRSKGVHACCCCLARCTCPPTHPFISLGRRSCSCCGLHPIVLKARPSFHEFRHCSIIQRHRHFIAETRPARTSTSLCSSDCLCIDSKLQWADVVERRNKQHYELL